VHYDYKDPQRNAFFIIIAPGFQRFTKKGLLYHYCAMIIKIHKEKPSLPFLRHDYKDPQRKAFFTILAP
jgi:hypothetical protein